ncbi:hypothetical protein [Algoriphagus sanaruensis]|nr:hypothetical protein [Algoriphagus sanaruensis]
MNSHLGQVLDCFARMDVAGLEVLLQEPIYYDVPKEIFLKRLGEFFENFFDEVDPENSRLTYYPGACCSRQCDIFPNRLGFKFHGYPGDHFDLRFVLEKDVNGVEFVKDIFPCYHLVTNELIEDLGSQVYFWVYEDDKTEVIKDENYPINLQRALEGAFYWESKKEGEMVTLEEIKAWRISYESTYLSIDSDGPSKTEFWKWDNFLGFYSYLDLLVRFTEDFKVDLARFIVVDISEISHQVLIKWLLEIENRMEDHQYWRLHGSTFTRLEQEEYEGKLNFPFSKDLNFEPELRETIESFLGWFAKERKVWLDYYFALTPTEYDSFIEQCNSSWELFQVNHLLSYHWEVREKFRKQGVFIPFNLKKPPFSFPSNASH